MWCVLGGRMGSPLPAELQAWRVLGAWGLGRVLGEGWRRLLGRVLGLGMGG